MDSRFKKKGLSARKFSQTFPLPVLLETLLLTHFKEKLVCILVQSPIIGFNCRKVTGHISYTDVFRQVTHLLLENSRCLTWAWKWCDLSVSVNTDSWLKIVKVMTFNQLTCNTEQDNENWISISELVHSDWKRAFTLYIVFFLHERAFRYKILQVFDHPIMS